MKIKWDTGEMEVIEETLIPNMTITKFKKLYDLAEKSDCIYKTDAVLQMKKVIEGNIKNLQLEAKALLKEHQENIETVEQMKIKWDEKDKKIQFFEKRNIRNLKSVNKKFKKFKKMLSVIQKGEEKR